jgi:hypothetical protein
MCTSLDDAKGILSDECGICPTCHDHKPCGCEPEDDEFDFNVEKGFFDFNDEKRRSESE